MTTPDAMPRAHLVSAEDGWNPSGSVEIHDEDGPIPQPTLGRVGPLTRVTGPDEFPLTMLMRPVLHADLTGIDPTSVRMFRWDESAQRFQPVWRSGLNRELGYVWSEIRRSGAYLAIGLPRDSVVRDMLRGLARDRRFAHTSAAEEHATILQSAFTALLTQPAAEIEELRQVAARIEVQTGYALPGVDVRLGEGGAVLPPPLPQDITLEQLAERVRSWDTLGPNGLPEETLFSTPDRLATEASATIAGGGLLAAATLTADAPVSTDWPMYHHDPQRTGAASGLSNITSTTVNALQARFTIAVDGPVISVPSMVAGKIFVGTGNSTTATNRLGGTVYRIDAATGVIEKTFTFDTPARGGSRQGYAGIGSSPAVVDGKVYVSGLDGKLYCLDAAQLTPIWITDLRHPDPAHNQPVNHTAAAEGWCSPLVIGDRVYVGFGEGESDTHGFVYCLNASDGNVRWLFCTNRFDEHVENQPNVVPRSRITTPLPPGYSAHDDPIDTGTSVWSSAAYDPDTNTILVGTGNSTRGDEEPMPDPFYGSGALALDADTGELRGFYQPAPEDSYRDNDLDLDVPASATIFTLNGQRVAAIGAKSGAFALLDVAKMTPIVKRQLLPVDRNGQPLPNVDPDDGGRHENKSGVFGTAALHPPSGRLFIGLGGYGAAIDTATTPFMRAVTSETLADAWTTTGDNPPTYALAAPPMYTNAGEAGLGSPAVVNDVVFIGTTRPGFYAFSVDTGVPLWTATDLVQAPPPNYIVGPAISGDTVVLGHAAGRNGSIHVYAL